MTQIDWSKAGKRLRRTPAALNGDSNPDWNFRAQRWKTAPEYAGEELTPVEVAELVACPYCDQAKGDPCLDVHGKSMADGPHAMRRLEAGEQRIADGWKL